MQLRLMYVNLKEKHLFLYVQTERTTNGKINQSGKEGRSGCFYGTDGESENMYKAARSVLCNDEDIADAISDTILVCWEKFSQLKEDRYFRTWMTRILLNKCTDILRKRKQMVWMDEIPETPDVDAGFENSEWKEALNSLSENFRLVVMLYYIEGFKTSEISQILDIPEGTVRSRLARGREQLAGLFQVKVVN